MPTPSGMGLRRFVTFLGRFLSLSSNNAAMLGPDHFATRFTTFSTLPFTHRLSFIRIFDSFIVRKFRAATGLEVRSSNPPVGQGQGETSRTHLSRSPSHVLNLVKVRQSPSSCRNRRNNWASFYGDKHPISSQTHSRPENDGASVSKPKLSRRQPRSR